MRTMVKLGWKAGPEQYQPDELLEYAVVADQSGFESLDVSDHFHPWAESGHACFSWTWLGAAAVKTKKIELGPGVTCPILRYHPSIIAQASATLDNFAPGRTYLAIGTGEALNEYSAVGAWPDYDVRQDMMRESIDLIRQLWTGDEITFNGMYYNTQKARLYTPPVSDIPLYVSSLVPESAGFAGIYGDGLITVGGNKPEHYEQMLENFEVGAREVGKDPSSMPRLIELNVAYTEDTDSALQIMHDYWAGAFVPALFNQNIHTPKMSEMNGTVVGKDSLMERMCVSGDINDHINYAQQFIDMGFTHLYFHCAGPDQKEFLINYGRDVLPGIREKQRQTIKI